MRRLSNLLVVLALVVGCRDSTAPKPATQVFTLQSIGGAPLPWAFSGDTLKVHSGRIELKPDSTYNDILHYDYAFSGQKLTKTDTITGRYRVEGAVIAFMGGGQYSSGGYNGKEITLLFDNVWRYVK